MALRSNLTLLLAASAVLSSTAFADLFVIDYRDVASPNYYSPMPYGTVTQGEVTQLGMYVNPAADGTLEAVSILFYTYGTYDGTFRINVYDYDSVEDAPGSAVTGNLDLDPSTFDLYPTWQEIDLTSLGYSFLEGEPFFLVWEFLPTTPGTDEISFLYYNVGTNDASTMGGHIDATSSFWGYWWTGADDIFQTITVDYAEAPPGDITLNNTFQDLGRTELNTPAEYVLTATNTGGLDAIVTSLTTTNLTYFTATTTETLPFTMAPGDTMAVTVTYNPLSAVAFRDTATVLVNWNPDGLASTYSDFFTIAGSTDCEYLSNTFIEEEELPWFISQYDDTTDTSWYIYSSGLYRGPYFAGHPYSDAGHMVADMLWTYLPNPDEMDIELTFAQNMRWPDYTYAHNLYVGYIDGDSLTWDYYFDLSDSTSLVWGDYWEHIGALCTGLADTVAIGIYYEGEDADDWFVDDVEFCFVEPEVCDPVLLNITYNTLTAYVDLSWVPIADTEILIYGSIDPYGTKAFEVTVDGSLGTVSLPMADTKYFYHAVVNCDPELPVSRHEATIPVESMQKYREQAASRSALPVAPMPFVKTRQELTR